MLPKDIIKIEYGTVHSLTLKESLVIMKYLIEACVYLIG